MSSLQFETDQFSFEVIVVDNQSNDGKLKSFAKNYPKVHFVKNSGNNGFANGCNFGATKSKGDYLLFLNPDTIANQDSILQMFHFAKTNPTMGITSCLQKKVTGGYEKSDRKFLSLLTLFGFFRMINRLFYKKQTQNDTEFIFTDWVSGSVVFISREWFDQIGGWNEDYWMYYEDMDLSKRIHLSNGKVVVLKNCEIIHNHGGSSRINLKTASITKTEVFISKHVFISNHFKGAEKYVSFGLLIIYNLIIRFLLGLLGILLFFIPKLRLNVYLLIKIVKYYFTSLINNTWLSPNSMNYKS